MKKFILSLILLLALPVYAQELIPGAPKVTGKGTQNTSFQLKQPNGGKIIWNATSSKFELKDKTGALVNIQAKTPATDDDVATKGSVSSLTAGKADKVVGAVSGNFAGLNASGNLTDSGRKPLDIDNILNGTTSFTQINIDKLRGDGNTISSTSGKLILSPLAGQDLELNPSGAGVVSTPVQIKSTLATGTAPLNVTSTTVNTNLNADLLDGKHATDPFDSVNTETLTGNKVLTTADVRYQYLNINNSDRDVTLPAAGTVGKIFTIANTDTYNRSTKITIKNSSGTTLDLIYAGGIKSFIDNGTNYIGIDSGIDAIGSLYKNTVYGNSAYAYNSGTAYGYGANGHSNGVSVGYGSFGYSNGVGVGNAASGMANGVAIGDSSTGLTYGTAIGKSAEGRDYSVAVGAFAKADATTGTSLYNIAIGGGTAADATASVSTKAATIVAGKSGSIVIGHDSYVNGDNTICIGNHCKAPTSGNDVDIGAYVRNFAGAGNNVIIGGGSSQSSNTGVQGTSGACIGTGGSNSIVIGNDAESNASYGLAVGQSAKITKAYQISLGGRFVKPTRFAEFKINSDNQVTNDQGKYSRSTVSWLRSTTDATPVEIFLNGPSTNTERLTLQASSAMTFSILVTARDNVASEYGSYEIKGACKRDAANNSICTATTTAIVEDDAAWDIVASADDTNDALILTVTGDNTNPTQWNAVAQISETHF